MLWEKLVDTPVRGVVYEAAGPLAPAVLRARARGRRRGARDLEDPAARCSRTTRPTTRAGAPALRLASLPCSVVEGAWARLDRIAADGARGDRLRGRRRGRRRRRASSCAPRGARHGHAGRAARRARARAAARGRASSLDLGELRFLDTSGLRLILETAEAVAPRRLRVRRAARAPLPSSGCSRSPGVAELVPFEDRQA